MEETWKIIRKRTKKQRKGRENIQKKSKGKRIKAKINNKSEKKDKVAK